MARSAPSKSSFEFSFTCRAPSIKYSTGSSTVMMLSDGSITVRSAATSVVLFPLPVGPVMMMIPNGFAIALRTTLSLYGSKPRSAMLPPTTGSINTRMTIDSNLFFSSFPIRGITETRKRMVFLSIVNCANPSWAMLRSNRSRFFALSFTTAETASARVSLFVYHRDSFPSTRK